MPRSPKPSRKAETPGHHRARAPRLRQNLGGAGRHQPDAAEIAHGKAYGALAMGMGIAGLFQRAQEQAYFVSAVNTLAQGRLVPVPGGVLIRAAAYCSLRRRQRRHLGQ